MFIYVTAFKVSALLAYNRALLKPSITHCDINSHTMNTYGHGSHS